MMKNTQICEANMIMCMRMPFSRVKLMAGDATFTPVHPDSMRCR